MEECTRCIFGLLKDVGYSNYTVEGTNFHCRKHCREVVSVERHETLLKPDNCDDWMEGQPTRLSVEDKMPADLNRDRHGYGGYY